MLAVTLVALAACSTPERRSPPATVRDSLGIQIVTSLDTAPSCTLESLPSLDLGVINGPDELQFQAVGGAATTEDGRVVVVDGGSQEVRVFGPDGTFRQRVGGRGEGPGEFRAVSDVLVTRGDTLVIIDQRPLRVSWFSPEGAFLRSLRIEPAYVNPPRTFALLDDGSFVISADCCHGWSDEWQWTERHLTVARHGLDGQLADTLVTLPFGEWALWDTELAIAGYRIFESFSHVAAAGDRIVVGLGRFPELAVYDPTHMDRPVSLIRWDDGDRTVTNGDIEAFREWERSAPARAGLERDHWYRRSSEVAGSPERRAAEQFPAHGRIRIGPDGTLWAHRPPHRPDEPQEWLSFTQDGTFRCRLAVPFEEPWDTFELGADYVLGLEKDELDVQHVRLYRYSMPPGWAPY